MIKGSKHSLESKLKMGITRKGYKNSLGHRHSKETKLKMSIAKMGTKNHLGYFHSEETKRKMSIDRMGKRLGEKNSAWKGGVTTENHIIRNSVEFRLWREAVFARDNWVCQKTKIRGVKLHAHHIQNFAQFPELRFAIDNGVTLSKEAHRQFHHEYGNKNNTKEQMNEFLDKTNAKII